MSHWPIKAEALGMLGGETQGGERAEGLSDPALARHSSTPLPAAQYPNIVVYCDGLTEPINPGGWGCWGWVATDGNGTELASGRGCLGHGAGITNNLSEYTAALEATDWSIAQGQRGVVLRADSRLVVEQTAGRWDCNAEHLRPLRDELRARLAALGATIEWIPREANTRADELSRLAYAEARRGATR